MNNTITFILGFFLLIVLIVIFLLGIYLFDKLVKKSKQLVSDIDYDNNAYSKKSKQLVPYIDYDNNAYSKIINPMPMDEKNDLNIENSSYSGYEIERYQYENEDIEKILSKNVKFSFRWKNMQDFTNVKTIIFKRYVFDETMNKSGPLDENELKYETSGDGYVIDVYSINRPTDSNDENMKYFKSLSSSDLVITFDNDKTTVNNEISTCMKYSTDNDELSTCVREDLYNVIGRNYITIKVKYLEDVMYPEIVSEKYLYKGGNGISIQVEDLDMSLKITSTYTSTFSPNIDVREFTTQYDNIKYLLKIGDAEIARDLQLENVPAYGNKFVYFKKGDEYFYIDNNNILQQNGTVQNKQLFTLIQSSKPDDNNTTFRILRVGTQPNEYRYATYENSRVIFKSQSEINTETLWDNMNIAFSLV